MNAQDYLAIERTIETLRTAEDRWKKLKKVSSGPGCDKHGFGFNLDSSFSAFSVNVSLDSWTGYYGSSSCCNWISFANPNAVAKAFIQWLNSNRPKILEGMADVLEFQNQGAKAEYIAKLRAELKRLENEISL